MTVPVINRDAQAGLSLVEVLVTLALIGVASGAAVLTLGFPPAARTEAAEAARLVARLNAAVDEAILAERTLVFDWSRRGYVVRTGDRGATNATSTRSVPSPPEIHDLTDGLRLVRRDARSRPLVISPDLLGGSATVELRGRGAWVIDFDGLRAAPALRER